MRRGRAIERVAVALLAGGLGFLVGIRVGPGPAGDPDLGAVAPVADASSSGGAASRTGLQPLPAAADVPARPESATPANASAATDPEALPEQREAAILVGTVVTADARPLSGASVYLTVSPPGTPPPAEMEEEFEEWIDEEELEWIERGGEWVPVAPGQARGIQTFEAVTDNAGRFRFVVLARGTAEISVSAYDPPQQGMASCTLAPGDNPSVHVQCRGWMAPALEGVVRFGDGTRASGVQVQARWTDDDEDRAVATTTDGAGSFVLPPLPPLLEGDTEILVTFRHPSCEETVECVSAVQEPGRHTLEPVLHRRYLIRGTVRMSDGSSPPDLWVWHARLDAQGEYHDQEATEIEGRTFELAVPRPGIYAVAVEGQACRSKEVRVDLRRLGEARTLEIEVERVPTRRVRVVDAEGVAVPCDFWAQLERGRRDRLITQPEPLRPGWSNASEEFDLEVQDDAVLVPTEFEGPWILVIQTDDVEWVPQRVTVTATTIPSEVVLQRRFLAARVQVRGPEAFDSDYVEMTGTCRGAGGETELRWQGGEGGVDVWAEPGTTSIEFELRYPGWRAARGGPVGTSAQGPPAELELTLQRD